MHEGIEERSAGVQPRERSYALTEEAVRRLVEENTTASKLAAAFYVAIRKPPSPLEAPPTSSRGRRLCFKLPPRLHRPSLPHRHTHAIHTPPTCPCASPPRRASHRIRPTQTPQRTPPAAWQWPAPWARGRDWLPRPQRLAACSYQRRLPPRRLQPAWAQAQRLRARAQLRARPQPQGGARQGLPVRAPRLRVQAPPPPPQVPPPPQQQAGCSLRRRPRPWRPRR